jgi:thioesterase domain-containing protein
MNPSGGQQSTEFSSNLVMMSLARLARLEQESQVARTDAAMAPQVVRIAAGTEAHNPPLILIHPIGGSIIPYRDLSVGLRPDRAIYGIQSQADEERNTLRHATIASLAEDYVEQILSLGLGDRYVIGGYSLGGSVAFEMARLMRTRGVSIDTLLIIDTPAQIRPAEQANHDCVTADQLLMFGQFLAGRNGQQLRVQLADLQAMPLAEGIQTLLDRLRELKIIRGHAGDDLYRAIYGMARHNELLQRAFSPTPYFGHVSLVRTAQLAPEFRIEAPNVYDRPDFGWGQYCRGGMSIKRVAGSHFQLLYPPFISGLAVAIQKFLDEQSGSSL